MNSPSLQNKVEAEQTLSSILNPNITNKNEPSQKYNNDYYSMRSSSYEVSFYIYIFFTFLIDRQI